MEVASIWESLCRDVPPGERQIHSPVRVSALQEDADAHSASDSPDSYIIEDVQTCDGHKDSIESADELAPSTVPESKADVVEDLVAIEAVINGNRMTLSSGITFALNHDKLAANAHSPRQVANLRIFTRMPKRFLPVPETELNGVVWGDLVCADGGASLVEQLLASERL